MIYLGASLYSLENIEKLIHKRGGGDQNKLGSPKITKKITVRPTVYFEPESR